VKANRVRRPEAIPPLVARMVGTSAGIGRPYAPPSRSATEFGGQVPLPVTIGRNASSQVALSPCSDDHPRAERSTLHCYSIAGLGGSELNTLRPRACVTRILYDARDDFSGNQSAVRTTTSRGKAWRSRRRDQFHSLRVSTNNHVMRRTRREPPPACTQAQVVVSPMITIISSLRPVDTGLVMRGLLVSQMWTVKQWQRPMRRQSTSRRRWRNSPGSSPCR
jgi:hypothetical protein